MLKILPAIFLGGIIGASIERYEGFLMGAVLGYLLVEILRLKQRVAELEQADRVSPRQPEGSPARTGPGIVPDLSGAAAGPPLSPQPIPGIPTPGLPGGVLSQEASEAVSGPATMPSEPAAPTADAKSATPLTGSWGRLRRHAEQWLTGGNLLVKVGVLVLFVGLAFLVRYAAERNIIPIEVRLSAVALGGVALLGIGWRIRLRRGAYGLVLQGGAVAVLYLTVFGAMRLYGLIPPALAFPVLVGIAVLSGMLAVPQDARILATIGTAGGFAAPILASTGQGSHVALFSYYAVLNLGIIGIAWFKAWRELNLAGFLFTFTIGTVWGVLAFRPEDFATTEPFLVLFFLLYVGVAVLFALRQPPDLRGYVDGTIVLGLPVIGFALQSALVKPYPLGLAWSAFALAGFYIGTAWILHLKAPKTFRLMVEAFLTIGVAFGTLAIPMALDNRWTAAAWAMEGAALVWIGLRQDRLLPRLTGMALQLASGAAFLYDPPSPYGTWPALNGFWLGGVLISLAGLFTSWAVRTYRDGVRRYERHLGILLGIWGLLWWYGTGIRELDAHGPAGHRLGALLLFLSASGLAFDALRATLTWPFLGFPSWGLIPALALVAFSLPAGSGHPFQEGGWWGWPAGLAACHGILWRQEKDSAFPGREGWLHPPCLWLATMVLTGEMAYRTARWLPFTDGWTMAVTGLPPAVLVLLITQWGDRLPWPVGPHRKEYLLWGCLGLCGFLVPWMILTWLGSGSAAPLPYLPFLNPLDVATILALLSILLWVMRLRDEMPLVGDRLRSQPLVWIWPSIFGSAVFLWLNAVLARTLHHWTGVAYASEALMRSVPFQASLSILWSLTALCVMVLATRRSLRAVWMAGAGLLGATVVKLFLLDLAKSGTLGRVISFITVGILILIVGYFSPVPPRRKEEVIP
jgi:uncharacterized membrane protein